MINLTSLIHNITLHPKSRPIKGPKYTHSPPDGPAAVTSVLQPSSTIQTSETPTPDLCRDTGRHRARPASSDAKRRLQRDGIATTTTSTPLPQPHDIARRRNAETGSLNPIPSLTPNRIRQNQSLSPSKSGISLPGAVAGQIETGIKTNTVSVCCHISWFLVYLPKLHQLNRDGS
jgi:hypothetical protein